MTVFGYLRAAIYAGDIYLHVRSKQLIHELAQNFDGHIRAAEIHAHEAADFVRQIKVRDL